MKKFALIILLSMVYCPLSIVSASSVDSYAWADICAGRVTPASWYASQEAQNIADIVIAVQKNNGGWMKNDQLHKLTNAEYQALVNAKSEHSCLDNFATTQEMRYLARVWKATDQDRFQTSFLRGLNMILAAQKGCGGWSQYWPLSGNYSYQDYITFNDDLMTNVMRMMRDIYENNGDFADITDAATRIQCREAFDRGIQCILDCQVNDNGVLAAWCAQHDTVAPYYPMEGRPHELPSISGYESANLLSFLMTIDNPSEALKYAITSAVNWLDAHKIPNKAVQDYTNGQGQPDRRIIDQTGTHLWGRFIQIGGESGTTIYEHFFAKLKKRNKSRSYTYNGVTYTYTEEELARANYNPSKAYQPIYAIYKDTIQHMYYRFLYNYEDTPMTTDAKGCPIYTSLMQTNRVSYQYIGSWPQRVIEVEYPAWEVQHQSHAEGDYTLSANTYVSSGNSVFYFNNAMSIRNDAGKTYATGQQNTIKYSVDVTYTIVIPSDLQVVSAEINGYDNYGDADAYIAEWNGVACPANQYLFPAKDGGDAQWITYYIDMASAPARDALSFKLAGKQCCLAIQLTCVRRDQQGIETTMYQPCLADKILHNGQVLILRDNKMWTINGQTIR